VSRNGAGRGEVLIPAADAGVKIIHSQARIATSLARGKTYSHKSENLFEIAAPRAKPERTGAIAKYVHPAGRFTSCRNISTRAAVAEKMLPHRGSIRAMTFAIRRSSSKINWLAQWCDTMRAPLW
jgi:hypothetical protein